jgi:hypothetical protein
MTQKTIEKENTVFYRLLKHTRFVGNPECKPEVLWEGNHIPDLIRKHPRNYRIEYFSCDDFDTWVSMERMENDQWQKTDVFGP